MSHAWYYFEFCARDRLCGVVPVVNPIHLV
jgi:hypothetical protein